MLRDFEHSLYAGRTSELLNWENIIIKLKCSLPSHCSRIRTGRNLSKRHYLRGDGNRSGESPSGIQVMLEYEIICSWP